MIQSNRIEKTSGARACVLRWAAVAVMAASILLTPSIALADVTIDGTTYPKGTQAADPAGTWSYDGNEGLTLNGYQGGAIIASDQNLVVELDGDNVVTGETDEDDMTAPGIEVDGGDVTITDAAGEAGTLKASSDGPLNAYGISAYWSEGDESVGGCVTIDGATVTVSSIDLDDEYTEGIHADKTVSIKNGANVTVEAKSANATLGIMAQAVDVTDSTLAIKASSTDDNSTARGIYASGIVGKGSSMDHAITIANSNVTIDSDTSAFYADQSGDNAPSLTISDATITSPDGGAVYTGPSSDGPGALTIATVAGSNGKTAAPDVTITAGAPAAGAAGTDAATEVGSAAETEVAADGSATETEATPKTGNSSLPVVGIAAGAAVALLVVLRLGRKPKHPAE
ncbi:MAG: hypothetical protein U0L51_02850 [Olegusella sp.]|nr:hypothetical protein [Olegusella sp.]